MDKNETPIKNETELATEAIDSGAKIGYYDEQMTFTHTFGKYRIFKSNNGKATEDIPLILNFEYVLVGNTSLDLDNSSQLDNNELLTVVKSRVNSFINENDINLKASFLDNITFYSKGIGFENTVDILLPILKRIKNETDAIKIKLLINIPKLAAHLVEQKGYLIVRDLILPLITTFFSHDTGTKVIDSAFHAFVEVSNFISEEDKEMHVLNTVILLANDDEEESRVISVKLFNALANNIGTVLCEIYVVPTVASLAEDTSSKVRKTVASNFLIMCKSISKELISKKIIPAYEKLSQDSLWIVRKIACLSIHNITEICQESDIPRLLKIYKGFTEDFQKFVKNSAIEVIGYFTDALPRNYEGANFILDFYLKTLENLYINKDVATLADNEIFFQCAFNFPAILFYFGKDAWPKLSQMYLKMTTDKYYKVRKSLASSINEISTIIGKDDTEKFLIPVFDRFYREEGEIQKAIYKSMPKFLLNINHEKRVFYLEKLKKIMSGKEKWRIKKECVEILGNLGGIFNEKTAFEQILPICIKLCVDEVAEVRVHAAKNIKSLIVQFLKNDLYREKIKSIITAFSQSIKYIYRNLFLHLCEEMVPEKDIMETYFLDLLELLSRDRVPNIQIHMSILVKKMYESSLYVDNKIFRLILLRISINKNMHVQENLSNIPKEALEFISSKEEEEIINLENTNYLFNNRMEILRELKVMIGPGLMNSKNKFSKQVENKNEETNETTKKEEDKKEEKSEKTFENTSEESKDKNEDNQQTLMSENSEKENLVNKEEVEINQQQQSQEDNLSDTKAAEEKIHQDNKDNTDNNQDTQGEDL